MTKMMPLLRYFLVAGIVTCTQLTCISFSPLMNSYSPLLYAQTGTAAISGRILDAQNAVIPEAEVEIRNVNTNATQLTRSNNDGIYSFPALQPGIYVMNVRKQQFRTVSVTGIELHTQDSVSRNFVLQVGSSAESITVNANSEHMQTDSAAIGLLVDRTFVENMPLNGRSFQDLIALAPGSVSSAQGNGLYSVNGQHDDANYFTVDGVGANLNQGIAYGGLSPLVAGSGVYPAQTALGTTQALASVDALQEFRIQTSGYSAEYGRQPGGQIEIVTRSGANDLHGSLFDYFRNDALDANNWFANAFGQPRQAEHQNDFGGTLGGPIFIPKLYDGKDHTFFFFSYEGLRLLLPGFAEEYEPTVAFRQTAAPGVVPFLNAFPIPNPDGPVSSDGITALFAKGFSEPSSIDAISVRLDQTLGARAQVFVRYSGTPSVNETRDSSPVSQVVRVKSDTQSWTIGSTMKISNALLDEFRFNYSTSNGTTTENLDSFGGAVPFPKSLLLPPQFATDTYYGTVFLVPQGASLNADPKYFLQYARQKQWNVLDSISWTLAAHTVKFGVDYRRLDPLSDPQKYSSEVELTSVNSIQQGIADLVAPITRGVARPIFNNLSLYIQDTWKANRRFTLDYGLRWELNPSPGSQDGVYPLAVTQTSDLASIQLAPRGTPVYKTSYNDFAPRLGLAYEVLHSASHPLVLRGGIGLFYDTGQALGATGYGGYPFEALNLLYSQPLPLSVADLTPPSLNFPLTPPYGVLSISDPHLKVPSTLQWNVSVNEGLGARNTLTVSYVANSGRNILYSQLYNLTGINPDFTQTNITSNQSSSSYNALQVQDQGYVARGLQLIASYTWAHAIDNASSDFGAEFSPGFAPIRGNSDNDIRQVLNAALNYQVASVDANRFTRALTSGWLIANRFTAQTGYPFDVYQGTYVLPDGGQAYIRPDLVPGVALYEKNVPDVPGGWQLNPAAFRLVPTDPNTGAPVRQGTLGRNYIHGPGFWSLNTAVQRDFPLHERLNLLFRVEAFNIFNHPNFGQIDNLLTDPTFGQPVSTATIGVANPLYATGAARSLQLMLKLQF